MNDPDGPAGIPDALAHAATLPSWGKRLGLIRPAIPGQRPARRRPPRRAARDRPAGG